LLLIAISGVFLIFVLISPHRSVSEANHDKNSYDRLMKHRPNPSCRKRLLAADVDRPVELGEDAVGVRKLALTYASRISHNFGYGIGDDMDTLLAGYSGDA
jgi:hypothetical protein